MARWMVSLLLVSAAWASNCSRESVGFPPFTDPFPPLYKGQRVSLYPEGNQPPAAHLALGLRQSGDVTPRSVEGNPDPNGKIVLLSVGMSNTTQEFSAFVRLAGGDMLRNPRLVIVDGAVGGWDASSVVARSSEYWSLVMSRLQAANVSPSQVQVLWLKEADAGPTQAFPADAERLQREMAVIVQQARERFPNLKIGYLSSRIYAGYADTNLNPEPFSYQSGFAVKWLIEQQIGGAQELDVASGKAPWIAWGPYLWADGMKPRADGLSWACTDLQADGTHPSAAGQQKVARMLVDFFHSDATARPWYLAANTVPVAPVVSAVVNSAGYGVALATGSAATIFGTNLASTAAQAGALPLPHAIGDTRVEIDGVPALLYYVSPAQINFVLPGQSGQSLAVMRGQSGSAAVKVSIGFWAPGLFTLDGTPGGSVAALHSDGRVITAVDPARPAETVQMFGTGLGVINPLLKIAVPVPAVQVGGADAQVTYAGEAPGLPGVTQVNFTIPAGATAGSAVPVVFRLGGSTSNAAGIAIAAN